MSPENPKATLNKKSITAIADQVEARLREKPAPTIVPVQSDNPKNGHGNKKLFFWGAASGLAVAIAAPLLGKQARPAVRGAIKGGILAGRYVQRVAVGVKEDVQDLAAEAKADLNAEQGKSSQ
jgi:hypothetical protein